ncbi:MAG: sugar phosphate isomerase/epimerase [Chitinophagaceae bacterium]|nr:MAG: sugar phosphate isomerase/epimerase [Chitinophagaceae bacterium]
MIHQTRRKFIQTTVGATAASLLITANRAQAISTGHVTAKPGFQLVFMQTDWGFGGTLDEFCALAKKDGYDGIEVWWPADELVQKLFDALKKHKLEVGFLCAGQQANFSAHFTSFKKNLDTICANTFQKPVYVNCHSGKDYFTYEENKQLVDYVTAKRKSSGIPIHHETHRGRMLFAANIARNFAEKNPEMRLTLDISHWCAVHESMLADQKETVDFMLAKVDHIHARIGHPQGPQVNDPRAPEWQNIVKTHLVWWDTVIARKKANGERITILTEFGPPDYMQTLPYTRQPVANQWEINVYMMNLLKMRYS